MKKQHTDSKQMQGIDHERYGWMGRFDWIRQTDTSIYRYLQRERAHVIHRGSRPQKYKSMGSALVYYYYYHQY